MHSIVPYQCGLCPIPFILSNSIDTTTLRKSRPSGPLFDAMLVPSIAEAYPALCPASETVF